VPKKLDEFSVMAQWNKTRDAKSISPAFMVLTVRGSWEIAMESPALE
jgi:hypothetical protein